MFFFWQVLWASSAHSHLLLRLKIINLLKRAVGMMCAELRHVACPANPAAPTSSPAWETPVPWTRNSVQPVLPEKGRGAQWDVPLAAHWLATAHRQREHAPHPGTEGAEIRHSSGLLVGMSPGHPPHMWGQSESSTAKPGLAQLSQFLTPADSTDKSSPLTFLNVQGYGLEVTFIWSKPCPRQGHHKSQPPGCWSWPTGGSRAAAQRC